MFKRILLIGIIISFATGTLINVNVARAASIYDDNYSVTNKAVVKVSGKCSEVDISSNPFKYVLDSSTWYNPSDASNSSSTMYQLRESLIDAFADSSNGSWGVSQGENTDGSFKDVSLFWSDGNGAYLDWEAQESTNSVLYKAKSNGYVHSVNITCKSYYYGGGNDILVAMPSTYNLSSAFVSSGSYGISNFFIYNADSNYPEDYEGTYMKNGSPVIPISGSIQCFNGPTQAVTRVHVNPDEGAAGSARITFDGINGYDFTYYVSEQTDSYTLEIDCGSETMSAGPADPAIINNIWYCLGSSSCYLQD